MLSGPFGHVAAAMITPFADDGALDVAGARKLAVHLVDRGGCDALVVNGATGESPTTTDEEKLTLLRAVTEAVGDRARVTAGVGPGGTAHAVALAREYEQAGAHGLLVTAPHHTPPTQEAVVHHVATVADSTGLPVLVHDLPEHTGGGPALTSDSLRTLAEHPRVGGVKDCSHDLLKSGLVLSGTGLAYYTGRDEELLALGAVGAVGCVSTVAGLAGTLVRGLLDALDSGDLPGARARHQVLLPLVQTLRAAPSAVTVKALYAAAGLPGGPVRGPLLPAEKALTVRLVEEFRRAVSSTV